MAMALLLSSPLLLPRPASLVCAQRSSLCSSHSLVLRHSHLQSHQLYARLPSSSLKKRGSACVVKVVAEAQEYAAEEPAVSVIDSLDILTERSLVTKRLEQTAAYFKRLGALSFWGQLVCTTVAAVILAFSIVVTGAVTAPATLYLTAAGIAAAFLSVFWSFGYMRLAQRLRATAHDPAKAPPRAQVVKNLRNGILINILGMGAALLGMQATVGLLVAKALTSSAAPFLQGPTAGYSPVLALDVFLVQASSNTVLSHFLGLVFSLELLRSVSLS
ncbi:unnamed protein product [Sphagnum balticum]